MTVAAAYVSGSVRYFGGSVSTASPASGSPLFCMSTVMRRSSSLTSRWIVPGVNQATVPGARGVTSYPEVVRVCTAPRPPVTTYASEQVRCRWGVPPHAPSAAGQS
jgi:hypothetical protein